MNSSQEILKEIKKAKSILLVCHPAADYDSVGSNLAFFLALKQLQKKAKIIFADNTSNPSFSFLPLYDQIKQETWQEQDLSQFDLLVAIDASAPGQISKRSEVTFPKNLKVIVIDHHASNPGYGDLNLIDFNSPASAQILYRLFISWGIKITLDIATCFFAAIYSDSKFKYPGTNSETYKIASTLLSLGVDLNKIIFYVDNSNTKKSLKYFELALKNQKHFFHDQVVITTVAHDEFEKHQIKGHDQNLQPENLIVSIKGNDIVAIINETEPGTCFCSFRTRDSKLHDVSKLASALGGGGHPVAAGCRLEGDLKKASQIIINAIEKIYPDLNL